jgi:peptide deformylase
MFDVCRAAPGAGLAAVQLGELKRIFVADISRRRGDFEPIAFINPEIELAGSETVKADEGCLSFPNVWLPVARSAELNVRYFDLEGNRKEARCKELLSLVVQHEYDHLNGISIIDRVSKLRRDVAVRKIKRALQEQSAA